MFEAQHWETAYRGFNPDDVPHLLIQLQDDLSRARKREALWLSVILHLFVVILLWNSEKLMALWPHRPVDLAIGRMRTVKDATFLELPPDEQKLTRRPDAKVLSDKDRIATSKAPQINREDLKKILESARPGQPGGRAAPPAQGSTAAESSGAEPRRRRRRKIRRDFRSRSRATRRRGCRRLRRTRPVPNFNAPMTAGSAIEQAARAAAANRGYYGGGQGATAD